MVVPLGPGKFYGSSLPRPFIYTDVKYNEERVDPPVSAIDPLLSWANEAHWSMGGLSHTRLRLQGRIEGNVKKLRAEHEKIVRKQDRNSKASKTSDPDDYGYPIDGSKKRGTSVSPPLAPIVSKRRRFLALIDEEEEEEEEEFEEKRKVHEGRRRLARKLGDDFDRVASKSEMVKKGSPLNESNGSDTVSSRTRSRRLEEDSASDVVMKMAEKVSRKKVRSDGNGDSSPVSRIRTSPRLAKRGST